MPPVVAVEGLGLGESGLSGQPVAFGFGAAGVLGGEQGREEAELAGGGVLDGPSGHASGQWQVAGEFHDLFGGGLLRLPGGPFRWCRGHLSSM